MVQAAPNDPDDYGRRPDGASWERSNDDPDDLAPKVAIAIEGCPQDADEGVIAVAPSLPAPTEAERKMGAAVEQVRRALARKDYAALARYVPERGLCLAPSKGSDCRWMSRAEVTRCRSSTKRETWSVDTGSDEPQRFSCAGAMERIFLGHRGLRAAAPTFNCFRRREDNNGSSIIRPRLGASVYVELFADDPEMPGEGFGWRSLWLLWGHDATGAPALVGMISHYWGI